MLQWSCLLNQWNMFKFSVSSLDVGFAIYNGGNISSQLFNMGFLLWGHGGPKARKIGDPYSPELEEGWMEVIRARKNNSYADAVRAPRIFNHAQHNPARSFAIQRPDLVSRSNALIPVSSVFSRLQFPNQGEISGAGSAGIQTERVVHNQSPAPGPTLLAGLNPSSRDFCVRCLLMGHLRPACPNRIKCRKCKGWDHIASGCRSIFVTCN